MRFAEGHGLSGTGAGADFRSRAGRRPGGLRPAVGACCPDTPLVRRAPASRREDTAEAALRCSRQNSTRSNGACSSTTFGHTEVQLLTPLPPCPVSTNHADADDEISAFKTRINLTEYAAAAGYELDRKGSSRSSVAMSGPAGDKVLVSVGPDRHWIYCSVSDGADCGSIIDFVQRRERLNLGEVRRSLRPWLDSAGAPAVPGAQLARPPASAWVADVAPVTPDPEAVREAMEAMSVVADPHPYLVSRGIPEAVYLENPFRGRVFRDARGNAVFPHLGADREVCGFEAKNLGFTSFAKGGVKGLFVSCWHRGVRGVVIAESAVDALSYAAMFPSREMGLVSIGGALSPKQPVLLRRLFSRLPAGAEVVAATDHDPAGESLASQIEAIAAALPDAGLVVRRHRPTAAGADWNDVLRS